MNNLYKRLTESGGYALPYLLHLFDGSGNHIRLINDNKDITYKNVLYSKSAFDFSADESGESSLKITVVDNSIINMLENNYNFQAEIIGVLLEDGTVQEIKVYRHQYGTVSWDGLQAEITFDPDDRFEMTFPALIWSTYNNRGNS